MDTVTSSNVLSGIRALSSKLEHRCELNLRVFGSHSVGLGSRFHRHPVLHWFRADNRQSPFAATRVPALQANVLRVLGASCHYDDHEHADGRASTHPQWRSGRYLNPIPIIQGESVSPFQDRLYFSSL